MRLLYLFEKHKNILFVSFNLKHAEKSQEKSYLKNVKNVAYAIV